jgi:preprotein translocase subunit SecE
MKYGSIEFNVLWRTIRELCAVLVVCVVIGVFAAALTGLLEWLLT